VPSTRIPPPLVRAPLVTHPKNLLRVHRLAATVATTPALAFPAFARPALFALVLLLNEVVQAHAQRLLFCAVTHGVCFHRYVRAPAAWTASSDDTRCKK
jgi:hypothetical protein